MSHSVIGSIRPVSSASGINRSGRTRLLPGWHQLYHEDQTVAETLHEAGYYTALIADIPHMQRPGKNFHR